MQSTDVLGSSDEPGWDGVGAAMVVAILVTRFLAAASFNHSQMYFGLRRGLLNREHVSRPALLNQAHSRAGLSTGHPFSLFWRQEFKVLAGVVPSEEFLPGLQNAAFLLSLPLAERASDLSSLLPPVKPRIPS